VGRSPGSPRRKWIWARTQIAGGTAVGAAGAVFVDALSTFETAYGADLLGITVCRLRIWIEQQTATGTALNFATRIMDEGEFAALTAADGPAQSPHSDWMQWDSVSFSHDGGVSVDVRAMRKLDELNQGLLFAVSNSDASASTFEAVIQVGLKLP